MARQNYPGTQPPGQFSLWGRLAVFFILWLIISLGFLNYRQDSRVEEISYTAFKSKVEQGQVSEILLKGQEVTGEYRSKARQAQEKTASAESDNVSMFKTVLPPYEDAELAKLLDRRDVTVTAKPDKKSWLTTLIATLLPWVLIIGFFVYINKRMKDQMGGGGPGGGLFGIGKSKARKITAEEVDVAFDDVAGLENAKSEVKEMVKYLRDPQQFQAIGAELPKGVLLAGPPGTGKTLMARAMAGEAGVPFYSISGSEFIEMFVGVGASRVRDMFSQAKKTAPSLIFIDELDSIGRARGTGVGGGHDEREQTLNQILSEIDGFDSNESVIVIAATNRPDVLDQALVRPGRFDRQISLDMPQKNSRKAILEVHAQKLNLANDVDFDVVAGATVGFSGADLKNLVNEAALVAARTEKEKVAMSDFSEARDKIIMGVKREDRLSEEEKEMIAYHEAGHALTTLLQEGTDPLSKVTIIPRGRALGATEQVPEEDRHNLGKEYLLNRIVVMIGGRAAEEEVFGDVTSGAGDDLKKATQIARRMVCQWGMSEKVGLIVLNTGEPHPFLGRELTQDRDFSEKTAHLVDEEVQRILKQCHKKAFELLQENRDKLDLLAKELMEVETLSAEEIEDLLGVKNQKTDTTKN